MQLHHQTSAPKYLPFPNTHRRVLLYSHDTFGLGHLRRNLAIATHLLQRRQPFSALLLTGSPVAASWPMPTGLKVQALTPVVKTGAEEYASRDSTCSFASVKACREEVILESIIRYRPDVFLVDHAPAGMKGELLEALAFIREEMPQTRTVLGLRDILDSPESVRSLWQEQNIYRLLDNAYDHILVYGSRHLFDLVHEYAIPDSIAAKTHYCGYIARNIKTTSSPDGWQSNAPTATRPVVLVTAGGGGDGYPLLSAYLRALDDLPQGVAQSILVPGPLMAVDEQRALAAAAAQRSDVRVILFTTDLLELIQRADLVVSMAGYNTTAEILVAKKPAILVPRGAPRMEQRLRATLLHKLGLAWAILPEEDLVTRLTQLVRDALAGARPPHHHWNRVDLGGVHRVGSALDKLLGTQRLSAMGATT